MGHKRHHGILFTGMEQHIEKIHEKATELFSREPILEGLVSPVTTTGSNGYRSFAVFPDGSNEGWSTSRRADGLRDVLLSWVVDKSLEDELYADWCLVQYGDDDERNGILFDSSTV